METLMFRIVYLNGIIYHGLSTTDVYLNDYCIKRMQSKDFLLLDKEGKKIKASECSKTNGLATITSVTKGTKLKFTNIFINNGNKTDALNKLIELLDKENGKHEVPIVTFGL